MKIKLPVLLFIGIYGVFNLWMVYAATFSINEAKFMDLIQYWTSKIEVGDHAWSIQYFVDAQGFCDDKDVYKGFRRICNTLPNMIMRMYWLACVDSYKKGYYSEAKEYCLRTIEMDDSQVMPYISLWVMYLDEKNYWMAASYFEGAYLKAQTQTDKNTAKKYLEEAQKNISTNDDFWLTKDVKDILDNISVCESWYVYDPKLWECRLMWEDCSDWYIYNEKKTECVPDTTIQRSRNCFTQFWANSSLAANWKDCVCVDWYILDEKNTKCLINNNQIFEKDNLVTVKKAECDAPNIQLACAINSKKTPCPPVCLELYNAINWMYDNKLTIHDNPSKFWVHDKITREQASKFFVMFYTKLFNKPYLLDLYNPFKDINNSDPTLYKYILNSNSLGLLKGSNWKFMPLSHLTKAQAIAVIIRMVKWTLDEPNNSWYSNYLYQAESLNLLNNIDYDSSTLDAEDIVRWDVALILYRLYHHLKW